MRRQLWKGLVVLIKQVETSRKSIEDMCTTTAGLEAIASVGKGEMPLRITAKAGT